MAGTLNMLTYLMLIRMYLTIACFTKENTKAQKS